MEDVKGWKYIDVKDTKVYYEFPGLPLDVAKRELLCGEVHLITKNCSAPAGLGIRNALLIVEILFLRVGPHARNFSWLHLCRGVCVVSPFVSIRCRT